MNKNTNAPLRPDDINTIVELAQKEQLKAGTTFLEVIGKSYIENFISRMLAYTLLKTENNLLNGLLSKCFCKQITVDPQTVKCVCEKVIPGGRIDVFASAKDTERDCHYTLTIENKTITGEHNDQTVTYHKYIQRNYSKFQNAFFYLTPAWNESKCNCDDFMPLKYSDIYDLITGDEDALTTDFKKHIKLYFCEKELNMNEAEREILKHYVEITNLLADTKTKYDNKRKNLVESIKNELHYKYPLDIEIYKGSYRLYYRNNWWHEDSNKDHQYYFYAEIYFVNDDPYNIMIQATVKKYGNNSEVYNFLQTDETGSWENNSFYVHYKEQFNSDKELLSEEWKTEFKSFAHEHLLKALEKTESLYEEFTKSDYFKKISQN